MWENRRDFDAFGVAKCAHARVGCTLGGRWTLESILGIGGSATVYLASHRNGRQAAVKVLHARFGQTHVARKRFLLEGYAVNHIGHPGVVAILDDGEEPDGTLFHVMELLAGSSLAQHLARAGVLSEEDVVPVGAALLDVLAAAHDRGVLHRDIKPSNIFWTDGGTVKLLDFGCARVCENTELTTASGTVLGTPAFMAPELASGDFKRVDARTDIWAVGATMYQLLTGKTVHPARTPSEALVMAVTRRASPIATELPEMNPGLAAVVDQSLSFSPTDRWPNARAMARALRQASGTAAAADADKGIDTVEVPASCMGVHPRRSYRRLAAVIAAPVLVGSMLSARAFREPSLSRKETKQSTMRPAVVRQTAPRLQKAQDAERAPISPAEPLPRTPRHVGLRVNGASIASRSEVRMDLLLDRRK
jgi:serine/threonine protein kinase